MSSISAVMCDLRQCGNIMALLVLTFLSSTLYAGAKPDPIEATGATDVWTGAMYSGFDGITLYVSTTGSDGNNGTTPGTPVRSIRQAIDIGESFYEDYGINVNIKIEAGTYDDVGTLEYTDNQNTDPVVLFERWGTGEVNITSKAVFRKTENLMIQNVNFVDYVAADEFDRAVNIGLCENIKISNVTVARSSGRGMIINQPVDLTFESSSILDNFDLGLQPLAGTNVLFQNNLVRGNGKDVTHALGSGVKFGRGDRITVDSSHFEDNGNHAALWIDVAGNDITIKNSTFVDNVSDNGLTTAGVMIEIVEGPVEVYGNTMSGNEYGVYVSNSDDVVIENNTINDNIASQLAIRTGDRGVEQPYGSSNLWFVSNDVSKSTPGGRLVLPHNFTSEANINERYVDSLGTATFEDNMYAHVDTDDLWYSTFSTPVGFDGWLAHTGLDTIGSDFTQLSNVLVVPEPGSLMLASCCFMALSMRGNRRR